MSIEAVGAIWEAYFRRELTAEAAAERLAELHEQVGDYGFALPDEPDAVERATELTVALVAALQRRDADPAP
jgi:hypothetical protein